MYVVCALASALSASVIKSISIVLTEKYAIMQLLTSSSLANKEGYTHKANVPVHKFDLLMYLCTSLTCANHVIVLQQLTKYYI